MRRALEIARDLDRPIFPHEEVKSALRPAVVCTQEK